MSKLEPPPDDTENPNIRQKSALGTASNSPVADWPEKNPAAVQLGRLGGLKGGQARALSMSAERRSEIARLAALKRWEKPRA